MEEEEERGRPTASEEPWVAAAAAAAAAAASSGSSHSRHSGISLIQSLSCPRSSLRITCLRSCNSFRTGSLRESGSRGAERERGFPRTGSGSLNNNFSSPNNFSNHLNNFSSRSLSLMDSSLWVQVGARSSQSRASS